MNIVIYILAAYAIAHLSLHLLLIFFKLLFKLYYSKYKKIAKLMAPAFILSDWLVNMFSVTLIFRELPQEWLVTARLKRWKKLPADSKGIKKRRRNYAFEMCEELNESDPEHC